MEGQHLSVSHCCKVINVPELIVHKEPFQKASSKEFYIQCTSVQQNYVNIQPNNTETTLKQNSVGGEFVTGICTLQGP